MINHVAAIDIGKTNAKLALVDLASRAELAVVTRPNRVIEATPYRHFDVEGHWQFLLAALVDFHQRFGIDAISVTTHGAAGALLNAKGQLAAPILDYEDHGPDAVAMAYDVLRPDFAATGSPRLAAGLNLGAQFHWQFSRDPGLLQRVAQIVTYPQYWGHRLTGVAATDVTSLGCHTDLWLPDRGGFSDLVDSLGIRAKIAPARKSAEVLGAILPDVAAVTGLPLTTPVACGIHDSNASLFPHILGLSAPFSVVSTGTWVIAMSIGGAEVELDPAKDLLINVNALGDPTRSARFMGGREFDLLTEGRYVVPTVTDCAMVLEPEHMLMPATVVDTGPFQGHKARWIGQEPVIGSGARAAAVSYYLGLVTAHCLGLIGAAGPVIVEGAFARNRECLAMLAAATGRPVFASASATGTSLGAALLFETAAVDMDLSNAVQPDPRLGRYAQAWQAAL
jgi:sugar (pentulose or hexulose) kinase